MKLTAWLKNVAKPKSHPARGAWIETTRLIPAPPYISSHPARGAWIETRRTRRSKSRRESRPARGAWIETHDALKDIIEDVVAPRTGRVD